MASESRRRLFLPNRSLGGSPVKVSMPAQRRMNLVLQHRSMRTQRKPRPHEPAQIAQFPPAESRLPEVIVTTKNSQPPGIQFVRLVLAARQRRLASSGFTSRASRPAASSSSRKPPPAAAGFHGHRRPGFKCAQIITQFACSMVYPHWWPHPPCLIHTYENGVARMCVASDILFFTLQSLLLCRCT